jgi:hypothetical protein
VDSQPLDEEGSAPQEGWFSPEDRSRIDDLIGKLLTSNTKEGISRYHAMAEGYLLGLLDCYHVSEEHHDAVTRYLHGLALKRLKLLAQKTRR